MLKKCTEALRQAGAGHRRHVVWTLSLCVLLFARGGGGAGDGAAAGQPTLVSLTVGPSPALAGIGVQLTATGAGTDGASRDLTSTAA